MKRNTKYRLIRTVSELLIVTTLATGISHVSSNIKYPKEQIPYTQEDQIQNIVFKEELLQIENQSSITFTNPELEELIKKQINSPITQDNLKKITSLEINNQLTNSDLSDLKYLTNLSSLYIYDNTIDMEDIKYNQNLMLISLTNCTISNTKYLPNSIESIYIDDSKITDQEAVMPYYAKNIYLRKSTVSNLRLKNQLSLEKLYITSGVNLDMNNIKDCINLKELTILMVSNIKNANILKYLPSLNSINIDEYAAIWLDSDTLQSLPLSQEDKNILGDLIYKLDSITNSLITDPDMSEQEKINKITLYLLEKLDYDYEAVEVPDDLDDRVEQYNCNPLTTSLEGDLGICINYSCMFQALCNRVGLDTYQLVNDIHAWNAVKKDGEYKGYDLTYLELGPIVKVENMEQLGMLKNTTVEKIFKEGKENQLYYYEFNLDKIIDDNHNADYTPREIKDYILNIGYINENSLIKLIYKGEAKIFKMETFLYSYLSLMLLTAILEIILYKSQKKLLYSSEDA